MPKYSLIVPVFQCRQYLPGCVDSILKQQDADFELLLIDDGSPDGSGDLCEELALLDARIRVFHKANGGAASARNLGLSNATGDYVLFVDGDDTIAPECLSVLSAESSDHELVIFGMSFDYYRRSRFSCSKQLSCGFQGSYAVTDIAERCDAFFYDNQLSSACNKRFDRRILERYQLRFAEGMRVYEDLDFAMRYLLRVREAYCCSKPLYHYRHELFRPHTNSRLADLDRLRQDLARLNTTFLAFYREYPCEKVASVAANLYMQMLDQHLLQQKPKERSGFIEGLSAYISEPSFSELLAGGADLNGSASQLVSRIRADQGALLVKEYRKKRRRIKAKRSIKRLLRKI